MYRVNSNSEDETLALGRTLAKYLKKGDVVKLSGDLGAGKTLLVSGILDYYGLKDEASSPTFTIVNEYDLEKDLKLFHFDVYRLESPDEFTALGGEEFFEDGICLIEWAERIEELIPEDSLDITIIKDLEDVNKRTFLFTTQNRKYDDLIKEIMN